MSFGVNADMIFSFFFHKYNFDINLVVIPFVIEYKLTNL